MRHDDTLSWWCQKNRAQLAEAIAEHADGWKKQQIGLLDSIGARLIRDAWEPRIRRQDSRLDLFERR